MEQVGDCLSRLKNIEKNLCDKFYTQSIQTIDDIVSSIDQLIEQNEDSPPNAKQVIEHSREKFSKLPSYHKAQHACVSKYGKSIEKAFVQDISKFTNPSVFNCPNDYAVLNKIIFDHLCTEGLIEAATIFCEEAKLDIKDDIGKIYYQMNVLNNDIVHFKCDLALLWLTEQCTSESSERYVLETWLLGLKFSEAIRETPNDLNAKFKILRRLSNVKNIVANDLKQLAALMIMDQATLSQKMINGEQLKLIKPPHKVAELFRKVYLNFYGQKTTKPLEVCFKAGFLSMPYMIEQSSNLALQKGSIWDNIENFSLDFNLADEFCFHPRFICPVLKVQSTAMNRPHALSCGHVLTFDAIKSLSTGTNSNFKCPYCPVYTKTDETKELIF